MTDPRSTIYFVERAPVDNTYQHTIDFKTPEEQRSYWGSITRFRLDNYSYTRRERRFIQIDKSFDEIEGINYLFYRSSDLSKWFYCFVTDREYISDKVSRLYFEVDVMQSYLFDMDIKPSFITQAHVDRWGADHKPIYSITDEGLNYGPEYVTESAFRIAPNTPNESTEFKHGFYFVFCTDHQNLIASGAASEPTRIRNNPTPYCIYLVFADEMFSGASAQVIEARDRQGHLVNIPGTRIEDLQAFMANSSFGEYVKQIAYLQYFPFPYYHGSSGMLTAVSLVSDLITAEATTINADESGSRTITLCKITEIKDLDTGDDVKKGPAFHHVANMPFSEGLEKALPTEEMFTSLKANPRTTEYDRRFQSKLLCYPYRYNVFTDWTGAPAVIKNEFIAGDDISVSGSIGFSFNLPRRYWVENYRGDPEGRESGISQPLPLEQPVLSDTYYAYLLQNKNQISANVTNSIVSGAAGLLTSAQGAGASVVGGAIGGIAGGAPGVAIGAGMAALGGATSFVGNAINAAVNVQNLIRSENARQADLKNLPDTIMNSNDCSFAIRDGSKYLTFYRKKIACEFEEQLAQYWHMFGYKVNRLEIPRLKSRVRFNFVKTIGANITGPIESNYLTAIKAIFDNGITFWHYSDTDFHPLDYSYENPEVSLL